MSLTTYISAICDEEVEVYYDYTPGCSGSFNEPPEYPEVCLNKVIWRGLDILSVLTKEERNEIESECFDDVIGAANQALEDRAERIYWDREAA